MPAPYTRQSLLRTRDSSRQIPVGDAVGNASSLRELLESVNTASASARNAWLMFIGLLAYLVVTLAAITQKDLLLNEAPTLPFANLKIPLAGCFIAAPVLLLFFHFGLLVQHAMLYSKIEAFNAKLRSGGPAHVWPDHPAQDELHSYFFTQSFAGRKPHPLMAFAFHSMMMTSFILAPVFILFYFQIKFLPFHDELTTWLHRLYLLSDIVILITAGFFLGQFSARRKKQPHLDSLPSVFFGWFLLPFVLWMGLTRTMVFATLLLSLVVATIPDGRAEKYVIAQTGWTQHVPINCKLPAATLPNGRQVLTPTAWLFERKVLEPTQSAYRWSLAIDKSIDTRPSRFCGVSVWLGAKRNLDVADVQFVKIKDLKDIPKDETTINLRGRNLQYADFSRSDLMQTNFHLADLRGAIFRQSDLRNVRFRAHRSRTAKSEAVYKESGWEATARLQGVDFSMAILEGVDFREAHLEGANFTEAILTAVNFGEAHLQGSSFHAAKLQGASLRWAKLLGTDLAGADLRGANLEHASLIGANFEMADLQGADLRATNLGSGLIDHNQNITIAAM